MTLKVYQTRTVNMTNLSSELPFCARLLEDSHPHEYDKSALRIAGLCPPHRGQHPREYDKFELRIAILRPPPRGQPLGKAPAAEQLCS